MLRMSFWSLDLRLRGAWTLLGGVAISLSTLIGCSGAAAQISKADPQQAASAAIASLDNDGDGMLVSRELLESPGLQSAVGMIDKNRDGVLTADEIVQRFQTYDNMADVVASSVRVKSNGRPLAGATVTFSPEPMMGEGLQSYVCVTNDRGAALPQGEQVNLGGLPTGLYSVHIQHEGQGIDETRGVEIADDIRSAMDMVFSL